MTMIRDFTFVCPTEILAFNDALAEFKTKVLSTCISFIKRLHFSHLRVADLLALPFRLG